MGNHSQHDIILDNVTILWSRQSVDKIVGVTVLVASEENKDQNSLI